MKLSPKKAAMLQEARVYVALAADKAKQYKNIMSSVGKIFEFEEVKEIAHIAKTEARLNAATAVLLLEIDLGDKQ